MGFCNEGAIRAASTSLMMRGETDVLLRLPAPAIHGNDGEQLGLCTPQFSDVPLWPAAWRKTGQTKELLVGVECIRSLMGTGSFASAASLFESAVGIVVADVLYVIEGHAAITTAGLPFAYRLMLQGPASR